MTRMISDRLLSQLSEFITCRFGLHYPEKRWRDLERKTLSLTDDFGFQDAESCIRWIVTAELARSELDTIACRLTIGETYFFREKKSFDALEAHILPSIISSRKGKEQRLRIWSAGCATGEEAYSIAIMLHRLMADLRQWNITILATDVNPLFMRKASRGEYGEWSFRGAPRWLKDKYFTGNRNGRYEISDSIRKMVTLARLNLAEDPYPSLLNNTNAMDIIFCRNVLMYFSPDGIKKTVTNFHHSLLNGGWLVVSPCEASHVLFSGFKAVSFNDAVFYRKDGQCYYPAATRRFSGAATGIKAPPGKLHDAGTHLCGKAEPWTVIETGPDKFPPPPPRQKVKGYGEKSGKVNIVAQPPPSSGFSVAPGKNDSAGAVATLYEEALSLYRRGEYGEAAAKLDTFIACTPADTVSPSSGEASLLLARALANRGDFTAALEWLDKAIASDRLNPQPYYLQATVFQEQGFEDAAVISLKKALYVEHGFVLSHFALANIAIRRGKRKEAARHLDNAASLLRDHGEDDVLAGAEGLSARRLAEIIAETRESLEQVQGAERKTKDKGQRA